MDPKLLHLTLDLLLKVDAGELPPRLLADRVAAHLPAICPECAEQWEAYREIKRQRPAEPASAPDYRQVVAAAEARTAGLAEQVAADRRRAGRELEELLALPSDERLLRLERTGVERFNGPALTDRLLAEARTWLRHDPRQAEELLVLAERQVWRVSAERWGRSLAAELTARVLAHRANAQRVAGELPRAEKSFRRLADLLFADPVLDPAVAAELNSLEASLRQDQRRFPEAEALLGEAERLYRKVGEMEGVAKVLVQRGVGRLRRGEPERAVESLRSAEELAQRWESHELLALVRGNLSLALCESGKPEAARDLMRRNRGTFATVSNPWLSLKLQWIEGKIAARLGQTEDALRYLHHARNEYLNHGLGCDAALLCLDLARIHLTEGRTAEVRRLAEEMFAVFEARDVHAEAARALRLFQQAAKADRVTVELIAGLSRYLATARRDPRHRFRPAD